MNFQCTIGRWRFNPGFASCIITILLVPIFISLGFWQLGRMEFKNQLQEKLTSQASMIPLSISEIQNTTTNLRFNPLEITGYFLNQYPILLDNQVYKGQVGYRVIMPFQVQTHDTEDHPWILVDRGWIPITNRNEKPHIKPITTKITLRGIINDPPKPLKLKAATTENPILFPEVMQYIDFNILEQQLQHRIFPFLLWLPPSESPHTYQVLPITIGMPASRHLGYAIQWFAIALAVLIYYLVINIKGLDKNTDSLL